MIPRLTLGDIRWETPAVEPLMRPKAWRSLDKQVAAHLRAVDADLSAWAGHEPKTEGVDQLLDERLFLRPPDVMDTWPGRKP